MPDIQREQQSILLSSEEHLERCTRKISVGPLVSYFYRADVYTTPPVGITARHMEQSSWSGLMLKRKMKYRRHTRKHKRGGLIVFKEDDLESRWKNVR